MHYGETWTDKEAACLLLLIAFTLIDFGAWVAGPGDMAFSGLAWPLWGCYCLGREKWRPRPPAQEKRTIDATPGWEDALPDRFMTHDIN